MEHSMQALSAICQSDGMPHPKFWEVETAFNDDSNKLNAAFIEAVPLLIEDEQSLYPLNLYNNGEQDCVMLINSEGKFGYIELAELDINNLLKLSNWLNTVN